MTLTRYMLREVRRRPGRTVLTLVGIVIGVQALVAIPITIESTRRTHRQLYETMAGRASLEVVPAGAGGFAPDLARRLGSLGDVRAAVPVIQSTAVLATPDGMTPIVTLGIDTALEHQSCEYTLRSGSMLTEDDQVLLDADFAARHGVGLGQPIALLTPSGRVSLVHRYLGGMRHRLAPRGLRIVTMKPGPTDTPMTANYDQPGVHLPDPETVAQRILHGIDTGRTTIYVPGIWRWVMLIIRHIPGSIFLRMKL